MFNFSFGELLLLAIIGLLVIGPKQLPQVAKILARTVGEFKKAMREVTGAVTSELDTDILKNTVKNNIAPKNIVNKLIDDEIKKAEEKPNNSGNA